MQLGCRLLIAHAIVFLSTTRIAFTAKPPQRANQQTALLSEQSVALRGKQDKRLIPWIAKRQWEHNQRARRHRLRVQMLAHQEPDEKSESEPVKDCIACSAAQIVYGKYFSEDGDATDNSYFLFKDPEHKEEIDGPLPILIHFHGGGFYKGAPWKEENDEIKAYVSSGFAVVSVGYRMVMEKYYYEADDKNKTEELIKVNKKGKLSLDTSGKTMDDYEVRIGKQEFITKYLYDAAKMMDNLVENSKKLGLDPHRIVFLGKSTGGAGIHYLTWVYHRWNQDRYTPRGMVLVDGQLNYPIDNMLDATWSLYVDTMGPQTPLRDVVGASACPTIVGNHMCGSDLQQASDYKLCNKEWDADSKSLYCGEAGSSATLQDAQRSQKWPSDDPEVGEGMEKLWYAERNMQDHIPAEPFYIYVVNRRNGTSSDDVRHHSVYALNFAKYAEVRGHQYTVYYTDFKHMTEEDRGMERFSVTSNSEGVLNLAPVLVMPSPAPAPAPMAALSPAPAATPSETSAIILNYLSTHDWRDTDEVKLLQAGSTGEQVLYACLAAGISPFKANFTTAETTTRKAEARSGSIQATMKYPFFFILIGGLLSLTH